VLAGGIFHGLPSLATRIAACLSDVAPRSVVRTLDVEPARGAVRLALSASRGHVSIPSYF
jgi:hypothetical protein